MESGYAEVSFTRRGGNSYVVRIRTELGSAEEEFELPTPEELEDKLIAVESAITLSSSPPVRRGRPTAVEVPARRFGEFLFKKVFKGSVHAHLEYFLQQARDNDIDVMLGIQSSSTYAQLACLPWELMFDPGAGDYLIFKADIVRYLGAAAALQSAAVELPLQVLVVVASPSDQQQLNVERERASLESALYPLVDEGLVELSWLEEPDWDQLNRKLDERKWHVFHFIGHGGHDISRGEGYIYLVNAATGRSDRITATDLGRLLIKQRQLRLAVLNACDTARSEPEEHQMSVSETLVRNGVPGVAAMQYPISDSAAKAFTQVFYAEVSAGRPVNRAMSAARLALTRHYSGTLEWATPVLYLKHPTSAVFSLRPREPVKMEIDPDEPEVPRPRQPVERGAPEPDFLTEVTRWLEHDKVEKAITVVGRNKKSWAGYEQEVAALLVQAAERAAGPGNHVLAERAYSLALQADPRDVRLRSARDRARPKAEAQQREREDLLNTAAQAARDGDEETAVRCYERIYAVNSADAEVVGLLSAARIRLAVANVVARVEVAFRDSDWMTVIDELSKIQSRRNVPWDMVGKRVTRIFGRSVSDLVSDARMGLLRENKLPLRLRYTTAAHGAERLVYSPDSEWLATWGPTGEARLLYSDGNLLRRLRHRRGFQRPVLASLAFEYNTLWLVTAYGKPELSCWRVVGGVARVFSTDRTPSVLATLIHPLTAVSAGTVVDVWDVAAGERVHRGFKHERRVVDMVTAGSSREILLTATEDTVHLWSVPQVEELITRRVPGAIVRLAVDSQARVVVVVLADGRVAYWTAFERETQPRLLPEVSEAAVADVSPDGRLLAVLDGGVARLWDIARAEELPRPPFPEGLTDIRIGPDGWHLAMVNAENVTVYTCETPRKKSPISLEDL
ncbi:hypothetical protein AMIS_40150 [Actinoplanes missouriensis 431]|uniref:CHAT domain-containing protein n=1 Tax=Actinoplanes missouriensis (strain ATCC 14538 / DSM 43046 / CBS 188.64 / JCM 3121 / NBRC 102363 / NCIMB 12654 / NRRL B-3342 / UNCC 431) TaxID=512565 RepID=I0H898_ACTM4|nr:CHAT domain-containing protein [Actinoplanes missouriensis]BAL89235.1 hypothetical protein AMIS_40150 [Actinoplanes missouriensis 431]